MLMFIVLMTCVFAGWMGGCELSVHSARGFSILDLSPSVSPWYGPAVRGQWSVALCAKSILVGDSPNCCVTN